MKLEVGKRYVRRDGTITPPLMVDPWGWEDTLIDPETEMVYFSDGDDDYTSFVFSFRKDMKDLVAIYQGDEE